MWPRNWKEAAVVLFVVAVIPLVFHFELFVVLPCYIPLWSGWYTFHFCTGTFLLFNICSNMMAIICQDTSIRGKMLHTVSNGTLCTVCECVTPPRAHHCPICDVCILKRDHHCIFTSCCIGHHNQRYFLMFLVHMCVASAYSTYFNLHFVYQYAELGTLESILKLLFPLATLFVHYSIHQWYTFLVITIVIGCLFTGVLAFYHTSSIVRGLITFERNRKENPYDMGLRKNVTSTLGERWYLVWLSPFIESKLTHDGIHWEIKPSSKAE